MNCSLPGSSVHGIFQARILGWVAISFSRGSSQSRDRWNQSRDLVPAWQADSFFFFFSGWFFTTEPPGKPRGWDTKSLKAQTAKWLQLQKLLWAAVHVYPDPESLQRYYSDSIFFQVSLTSRTHVLLGQLAVLRHTGKKTMHLIRDLSQLTYMTVA